MQQIAIYSVALAWMEAYSGFHVWRKVTETFGVDDLWTHFPFEVTGKATRCHEQNGVVAFQDEKNRGEICWCCGGLFAKPSGFAFVISNLMNKLVQN